MIIQRLAQGLFWTGCSCHKKLLSFKAFCEILNICIFWLGAKIGDFSVRSAYDLSDHEAVSVTCEQCNEVPETSLHALWSRPMPTRQEVIRDFNENLVAAKVEVIVGQCWLEAHFAGFWHALQLCKNRDFRRFNLRAT
ncbi:hypothetical protein SO802_032199 [Lithocarpus litseifolius]|uniref:Reverse transcriptase n=1 Tax=Lithocarpus litseifolius TaxID=425828 RepID=A0AAW2BNM2_9ROSI